MEYYSNLNALPDDPVFRIDFECKNCGNEFDRRFDANVDVHPVGVHSPNFAGISEVNGNKYVAEIEQETYPLQCENCEIDTSLFELDREPL